MSSVPVEGDIVDQILVVGVDGFGGIHDDDERMFVDYRPSDSDTVSPWFLQEVH